MRSFAFKALLYIPFLTFLVLPQAVFADTLLLSPDSGSYETGRIFPVRVLVSSTGQSVNAVSGVVSFPTDKLQVVSVSKVESVLTLWVQEPTFSNTQGTVNFEGVVPNPGFQGPGGRVITINFRAVGPGNATVKFNTGSVLANDGSGTNVLRSLNTATFAIGGASLPETPVTPVTPVQQTEVQTSGLKIVSSTHPDQKAWYSKSTAKFNWNISSKDLATRILLGKLPTSQPTVVYEPAINSKEVTGVEDGIWYFNVQTRTGAGWGPVARYVFRVDTVPPEVFDIKKIQSEDPTDPRPRFSFSATDSMSGIRDYSISIDSNEATTWSDSGSGIYEVPTIGPGAHNMVVKAYDHAGNFSTDSIDFVVEGIESPKITSYKERVSNDEAFIVAGTAAPNTKVRVILKKGGSSFIKTVKAEDGESVFSTETVADEEGDWSTIINGKDIPSGSYELSAISIDERGAQSEETLPKNVLVSSGFFYSIGSTLLKVLAVLIPLIAVIFLLLMTFMHGFHRVRMTNKKFRSELHRIERLVDKAFVLLKEDVEDSIRLLERTKSKRKLTAEEDAIIDKLRQNLREAEEIIHNEVEKIDKKID